MTSIFIRRVLIGSLRVISLPVFKYIKFRNRTFCALQLLFSCTRIKLFWWWDRTPKRCSVGVAILLPNKECFRNGEIRTFVKLYHAEKNVPSRLVIISMTDPLLPSRQLLKKVFQLSNELSYFIDNHFLFRSSFLLWVLVQSLSLLVISVVW